MTLTDFIIRATRPRSDGAAAKILLGTGVGITLGLLAGLFFAPRSGSETRQMVAGNAKDTAKILKKTLSTASFEKRNPHTDDAISKSSEHPKDE